MESERKDRARAEPATGDGTTEAGAMVLEGDPRRRAYMRNMQMRDRRARWNSRFRYFAMHVSWIVVLVSGAVIPVAMSRDWAEWIVPTLGLVIVVFQGIDGIFHRTAAGGRAMDLLRRGLERERRLYLVRAHPYDGEGDPFLLYVAKCEELVGANDRFMVDYFANIASSERSEDRRDDDRTS